jgi:hypothetical protein
MDIVITVVITATYRMSAYLIQSHTNGTQATSTHNHAITVL